MNYKIHTVPIIDAYKTDCECPLCEIERALEQKLIGDYLNEAVMVPEYRVQVNKKGFCTKHFAMLEAGDNICGVALQAQTRMQTVVSELKKPTDAKKAAKEAARLRSALSTCVICEEIDEIMERYYRTTVELFSREAGFELLFRRSKGHCLRHYAALAEASKYAGKRATTFLDVLYDLQIAAYARLESELQGFIDKFDSRKCNDRPWGNSKDAVPRVIQKIR